VSDHPSDAWTHLELPLGWSWGRSVFATVVGGACEAHVDHDGFVVFEKDTYDPYGGASDVVAIYVPGPVVAALLEADRIRREHTEAEALVAALEAAGGRG